MTNQQVAKAASHFNVEHARQYDQRMPLTFPGYDLLQRLSAAILCQGLNEDAHLLIVGAGTGAEILELGRQRPNWRFTGVDPAPAMIAVAQERIAAAGLGDRTNLYVMTADELPEDAAYDAATALLVMHFLPDDGTKADFLRSISRRLRPGAPFVLADLYGDPASPEFGRLMPAWQQLKVAAGVPPENLSEITKSLMTNISFLPESVMHERLTAAGFHEIDCYFRAFLFGAWSMRKAGA